MALNDIIRDNLHFLIMEVMGQVSATRAYLTTFDQTDAHQVLWKQDYIANLRTTIENDCYSLLLTHDNLSQKMVHRARATRGISSELRKIADYCLSIAKQVEYLVDRPLWLSFDAASLFALIEPIFEQIGPTLESDDLGQALTICHCEYEVDTCYNKNFQRILEELRTGKSTESYITILFIFRYLERIGDALLSIGEALLFSILGDKIHIREFDALQQTLAKADMQIPLERLNLHSFWGNRSGCNISKVATSSGAAPNGCREAIFKIGKLEKIHKEKQSLEKWEALVPGLAPRVLTYHQEDEQNGSLLIEFLQGKTLQEIILESDRDLNDLAIERLTTLLTQNLWPATRKLGATETSYMRQVLNRLHSVHQVHSYLRKQKTLGDLAVDSTATLVEKCVNIERLLPAPFSVHIHGDFNCNNILFDIQENDIHFIDLYRSGPADYLQDVSTFLISNFRLPVFEEQGRHAINQVIKQFYRAAQTYAQDARDHTFDIRLTLALARSFFTSTRFQLNTDFVKEMVLRANFLLEKAIVFHEEKKDWRDFDLPEAVLFL